ncbi:MAG: mandelate racemase/muconate lactonizing enzyme family protein [Candidatus Bathyarchaeia archaeon]
MKVKDVKANIVKGNFDWVLVRVETDEGIVGVGEAYQGHAVKEVILKGLKPLVLGEDPLNIEYLYQKMYRYAAGWGNIAGTVVTGISGIEIALWDIKGKVLDAPVWMLLGGKFRDRVRIYCDCGRGRTYTTEGYKDLAREVRKLGFTAYKFDIDGLFALYDLDYFKNIPGGSWKDRFNRCLSPEEIDHVTEIARVVKDEMGKEFELALDCHWSFNVNDALRLAKNLEDLDLLWLEDPVPPENVDAMAIVTKSTKTPICTGENLYTRYGFRDLILKQAAKIVSPDIPKAGGLLESKKIADLADIYYIPIAPHNVSSPVGTIASAHVCASIPNFLILEHHGKDVTWWDNLVKDRPVIRKGYVELTDKPGLGVDLDENEVIKHLKEGEEW